MGDHSKGSPGPNLNHYDEMVEMLRYIVGRWEQGYFNRQSCGWNKAKALLGRLPNEEKAAIPSVRELDAWPTRLGDPGDGPR